MIKMTNALGAEMIVPDTILFRNVPLEINVPTVSLAGKHGGVRTGKSTLRPRLFALEGRIYYPDKNYIRQQHDNLLEFLMQPPIEVYQLEQERYLMAYPQGMPQGWIDLGKELELNIQMIALDPFWYGAEISETLTGTQVIEVAGTAPTPPVIATANSVEGLTISNLRTGQTVEISGATGIIEVYNHENDPQVYVGNESRLDLINDAWLLKPFKLVPGQNEITTSTEITLAYRPRWY